jgi:hypothetical protein
MTDTPELKPCPFCGGEAKIIGSWLNSIKGGGDFTPTCDGEEQCPGQNEEQDEQGGFCASYPTREEAAAAWNTRADLHADALPKQYNIGHLTFASVFQATGMVDVSDMQSVFDQFEKVLEEKALRDLSPTRPVKGNDLRCAECDCESGGTDCNWIKQPSAPMTGLEIARALSEHSRKGAPYRNTGFAHIDAFLRALAEQEGE